MYPRLSDIFRDLLGFEFPIPIYSFGAMVAVAVIVAAWLTSLELQRMHAIGRIGSVRIQTKDPKKKRTREQNASPAELIGTVTTIAIVMGVIGAKVFHILENLDQFFADPLGMIFSTGGLTFYGGLIFAGVAIAWYVRKKGVPVGAVADAVAPGLILAYGIGRIGCHLAGDGDWGIESNLAAKPGWLPTWLWAETYPNNILNVHIPEPGVYPTPLYEFAMAVILFGGLWALRKHPFLNGWLFFVYLTMAGVERFLIEQIRVNVVMNLFGMEVTQAEFISVLLIIAGLIGMALLWRRRPEPDVEPARGVRIGDKT